nr:DEAD/DEAH box helicase [Clostridium botulinum]
MNNIEIAGYQHLKKIEDYHNILSKLTLGKTLTKKEQSYILTCALILAKYYDKDRRFTSYIELAYYIILKYSIIHNEYEPLYDFSINFGFYPVAKKIYELRLYSNMSINDVIVSSKISKFKHENYIETIEQQKNREILLANDFKETCYIAPTSYGKSSVIRNYIEKYDKENPKIGIIVPTRSLLMQTYRMIKESDIKRKIIIHDEMFNDEEQFIAIFTQERTLRLFDKHNTYFDLLFIDEAHNIFNRDSRNILLARAIRVAKKLNPELKIIYLSPLIADSQNLMIEKHQRIDEQRISFNIKEPEIMEYKLNKDVVQYNRFMNEYLKVGECSNLMEYIKRYSMSKSFIYLRAPKKIESFSNILAENLPDIEITDEILNLMNVLKQNVHDDFYEIDLLKKGVIYLHGKLPDLIKEYLESKYKSLSSIKYIIANSVILEGMNLPIESLFILNTYALNKKELINLIGRVNRLNDIFVGSSNKLRRLLPPVHFINSEEYNRIGSNMSNKIKILRSKSFTDEVDNPILDKFDLDKIKDEKKKKQVINIIESEKKIQQDTDNEVLNIEIYLIKEGFGLTYNNLNKVAESISSRISKVKSDQYSNFSKLRLLDKINYCFIEEVVGNIKDYEIGRLKEVKSRDFYENHIKFTHMNTLKENIDSMYKYFIKRIEDNDAMFYMGESYGELKIETEAYENPKNVYVDLSRKNSKMLVNLAIVKIELENKFVNFKLNKFIVMLHDFNLISDEEYNLYIYGTINESKIALTKYGLSMNLISKLERDKQLENLYFDEYNNLSTTPEFDKFINTIDDFYRYEINRNL